MIVYLAIVIACIVGIIWCEFDIRAIDRVLRADDELMRR